MIVKKITDDGMIKFGFVGGVDPRVVIGRPVRFGEVAGRHRYQGGASDDRCGATMPKAKDLYIDIGASSRAAAEERVSLGGLWCVRLPSGRVWRWADQGKGDR